MGRVYLWLYHICLNNMRCYFLKTTINPVTDHDLKKHLKFTIVVALRENSLDLLIELLY